MQSGSMKGKRIILYLNCGGGCLIIYRYQNVPTVYLTRMILLYANILIKKSTKNSEIYNKMRVVLMRYYLSEIHTVHGW